MTMTPAMSKALDLHPARTIPKELEWDAKQVRHETFRALNRIRASITSENWPEKILAFHYLYNVPCGEQGTLQQLDAYRRILRRRLLAEEVKETLDADESGDVIETIDGLLDTIYVAIGWLIELGLSPTLINQLMDEVHASNLTKVDNNGEPVYDEGGKVLKGDNYTRVNLSIVLGLAEQGEPSNGQGSSGL